MGRPPAKLFWDTGGDKQQYRISETEVISTGHVGASPFNQDRYLGFPYLFISCRQDKEENFKLSHSVEVGEISYWLGCCERMTKVPFKASLRTACLLLVYPETAGLAQLGRT